MLILYSNNPNAQKKNQVFQIIETSDVNEKQKLLQLENCVSFGRTFKIPMIIKLEMPNPAPNSSSCDVNEKWKILTGQGAVQ